MNLRIKKLMNMPIGTSLKVHYGNSQVFSGVITDKDDECIAISNSGQEIVIDYEDIELYVVGAEDATAAPQTAYTPVQATSNVQPVQPIQAVSTPAQNGFKPSFEVEIERVGVSDAQLKNAITELDPVSKKKLNDKYNSFMYALRIADKARSVQCFRALIDEIECDDDLYDKKEVWTFAALTALRCDKATDEILIDGGCFFRAAIEAYFEERFEQAGAFACLAVLYDDIEDVSDTIYSILFNCCKKCDDASAAAKMLKKSDISGANMELLQALFAYKNKVLGSISGMSQKLDELTELYSNNTMVDAMMSIIETSNLENNAEESAAADVPAEDTQESEPVLKGQIVTLLWSREEGKIAVGDDDEKEIYLFGYDDVASKKLKKEIKNTLRTNVEEKNWIVTFELTADGKATNIKKYQAEPVKAATSTEHTASSSYDSYDSRFALLYPEEALKKGRYIISSRSDVERFAQAADTFEIALKGERYKTDALSEFISACMAYKNAAESEERGEEYITKALSKYKEMDGEIFHDFKYDVVAFSLMTKYGDTENKIKTIKTLLNYDTVKPMQRLFYIVTLADIYLKEADATGVRATYENAKRNYQEWESLFYSNSQLYSSPATITTYYTRVLLNLAACLIKIEENEQAEQILTKILKYDSSIEAANKMYNDLVGEEPFDNTEEEIEQEELENDEEIVFDDIDDYETDELENMKPYTDVAGWEDLNITEKQAIDYVLGVRGEKKAMYTVALLKVLSDANYKFLPAYRAVSLATDNPMERWGYSASDILSAFSENSNYAETTIAYSFAAASLRSAFYQTNGSDYMLKALCDSIQICSKYPVLKEIYDILSDFKNRYEKGVDTFASYRFADISTQESKLSELVRKISDIYDQEFTNKLIRESIKQIRFKIAKTFVYEKGGILETTLRYIKNNDIEGFEAIKGDFAEHFIRNGAEIHKINIQDSKVEEFINDCWDRAGKDERVCERKTSDLMGSLRNNLRSHITNIINVICDWNELYETGLVATIDSEEKRGFTMIESNLVSLLDSLHDELYANLEGCDDDEYTGICILAQTVDELSRKLTGEWNQNERKYYFADFLSTDCILLTENYLPDFSSTFYSLDSFNIYSRLCSHIENTNKSFELHAKQIFSREKYSHNFGTANMLAEFTQESNDVDSWYLPENANDYCTHAEDRIKLSYRQFVEDIQLANGKGQIMLYDEFMSCIEDTAAYWYSCCLKTKNYGFFFAFVDACMNKIHTEASVYKEKLLNELKIMFEDSPDLFEDMDTKLKVEEQIESLNFLVAEDWMNRLRRGDFYNPPSNTLDAVDNLRDFWSEFDRNYDSSKDTGVSLKLQINRVDRIPAKDKRGGMSLITNWLSNGTKATRVKIKTILTALGWEESINVTDISTDSFECYRVNSSEQHSKRKYSHPIAAFGTSAKNTGFIVVCLYGFYSADRLINEYRKLDDITGNKIILLDHALNAAERRKLARKVKEITLSNTYILIDRVSIVYIANHYVSGMNNGMLMSISMPFSYFQPYNDVSTIDMAPEMFIGREDELLSIESPTGANLIFGGRQLGKSSLLKKAKNDIDGDELGRKAIFLDLKETDYTAAALKISRELVDRAILPPDHETSDWDELERAIINRLRDENDEIPYLLLMLDEADLLIESSKDVNFLPMVKLKNIQQSSNGKFKFVLAGLHDLVRFNRSVALGKNSVITHLSSINIKPFRHEDAKNLLLAPLSYLGFSFDDNSVLISQILAATNYFPGLIQLYCKKLIEAMRTNYADYNESDTPPYIVTETHIKKVLSDRSFRDEIKKKFEITLTLDDTYYIIALIMALLDEQATNQNGYSSRDILKEAKSLDIDCISILSEEQIDAFLGELTDLNILKSTGNSTFLFSTKNFRDMLGSRNEIEEKLLSLME